MILALSHSIIRIFFREIIITGKENLVPGKSYIVTANHPNALLDPLLLQLFNPPLKIRFVAKAQLFDVPVFGSILRRLGAIPVVRRFEADGQVDYSMFFQQCVEALKAGDCVAIFPEGRSLPQPFLAPMKTGPARLFFLTTEAGGNVSLLPIGLNYERGTIFRSSVLIAIGAPASPPAAEAGSSGHADRVIALTEQIRDSLGRLLFQAENYRDRELMLLLERLVSGHMPGSWSDRWMRLKQFESALARLKKTHPREIDNIRHLLARYSRIASTFGVEPGASARRPKASIVKRLAGTFGLLLAVLGLFLNWIPYRLVGYLVKRQRYDESEAATFKIIYSLGAFPIFYAIEAYLAARWAGTLGCVLFCLAIMPLSYFTLRFFEWREEELGPAERISTWFGGNLTTQVERQLNRLQARILAEIDRISVAAL
jgi:1-acyl-sn-glycerol-3-phosphate acyltransferase